MNQNENNIIDNFIGVIHLTDIHLISDNNKIFERKELIFRSLKDDFIGVKYIFFVISGDIAFSGNPREYEVAIDFLATLEDLLKKRYPGINLKHIIVPGNHDCNFELDTQIRKNIISRMDYDTIGNDESVFTTCLKIQSDFWAFYNLIQNTITPPKIYYKIEETIDNFELNFHCFNTAWMSQKVEKPGTLFFPIKHFNDIFEDKKEVLNISVLHHPFNWFSPDTIENNRKEFQNILEDISSLIVIGHEHENEIRKSENIDKDTSQCLCLSGQILQDKNDESKSGFQTFLINLKKNILILKRYKWENNFYIRYSEKEILLPKKSKREININKDFLDNINNIDIPLNFDGRKVNLSDIYIFPDLEAIEGDSKNIIDDYIDSETLLTSSEIKNCILEGDGQIGKTSLLNMLFLRFYTLGYYPIIIEARELTANKLDKVLHKAFKSQYSDDTYLYEKYRQLDKKKKVILIDDFQSSNISKEETDIVLNYLFDLFERTIITIDSAYGALPQIQTELEDIKMFTIKSLGYSKSNDLVENYFKIKEPKLMSNDQQFLEKTGSTFNQLNQILGNKLIPSYPIFILSIVQALEYKPLNLDETSYSYCYHTLIHHALNNAGVCKNDIDTFINILTEYAYYFFTKDLEIISDSDFEAFYMAYSRIYVAPKYDYARDCLIRSKIFKNEFNEFSFGYKYIF
jgi:hypothetical protein